MTQWKNPDQDPAEEKKLQDILHPSTTAKTFTITLKFGCRVSPKYKKAVDLARRMPTYLETGSGEWVKHSAAFTPEDVEELFQLFNLIHDWDNTEILVNHKRLPYAHQLWIPLMWFYRI
ncbi:MAG: hypothetical protein R6V02_08465 [Candidatus Aminicenantes bacterium]